MNKTTLSVDKEALEQKTHDHLGAFHVEFVEVEDGEHVNVLLDDRALVDCECERHSAVFCGRSKINSWTKHNRNEILRQFHANDCGMTLDKLPSNFSRELFTKKH